MRVGTPPILGLAALDAALDAWEDVDMQDVRRQSIRLCDLFVTEVERRCPVLELASPRDGQKRGSQISFLHPEGYAIMQALISRGVIGDFRAPNAIRFGFTPLYLGFEDVWRAADALQQVLEMGEWRRPEFNRKHAVT